MHLTPWLKQLAEVFIVFLKHSILDFRCALLCKQADSGALQICKSISSIYSNGILNNEIVCKLISYRRRYLYYRARLNKYILQLKRKKHLMPQIENVYYSQLGNPLSFLNIYTFRKVFVVLNIYFYMKIVQDVLLLCSLFVKNYDKF